MTLPQIKFVAPIIRAATAQMQAHMADQVTAFNAEPANEVVLIAPQSYHFGGQDLLGAYAFPQVELAAVTGDTGLWAIGHAEVDHNPRVNVALWLEGDQGEIPALYEQTVGLLRCVIECLSPVGAFGPGVELAEQQAISWRADVIPADPTAAGADADRGFQKWRGSGLIQFRLEDVEQFG